jgi:hypothetical protein
MRTGQHGLASERSILLKFEPHNRARCIGASAIGGLPAPTKLFLKRLKEVLHIGRIGLRIGTVSYCSAVGGDRGAAHTAAATVRLSIIWRMVLPLYVELSLLQFTANFVTWRSIVIWPSPGQRTVAVERPIVDVRDPASARTAGCFERLGFERD